MTPEIRGRKLRVIISPGEIAERVRELGRQITADYGDKSPVLIGALKGGFIFLADLVREIGFDAEIDFIRVSSYGNGPGPGEPRLHSDVATDLTGRHVLLVEDILDTGLTMSFIRESILSWRPASFKICTLIDKKERRRTDIKADYTGFVIDRGFVVGYGTDCGEAGRNLPGIYVME